MSDTELWGWQAGGVDWQETRPLLIDATARLLAAVEEIEHPHETPSTLPGWSQAHVLTHLARNADGMRNLFLAARADTFVGMYASPELREADIMVGATRSVSLLRLDLDVSAQRLLIELDALPQHTWSTRVPMSADADAMKLPTPLLAVMRLAEVAFHHLDLGVGASMDDLPPATVRALLDIAHLRMRERTPAFDLVIDDGLSFEFGGGGTTTVTGTGAGALAWLTGRGDSSGVSCPDGSDLPELPSY